MSDEGRQLVPMGLADLLSPHSAPGGVALARVELYDGDDYAGFAACRVAVGDWRVEFFDGFGCPVSSVSGSWSPPHLAVDEYLQCHHADAGRVGVTFINMEEVL
ncbi:hypothetical protein [Planotetraspora sp. GP83]|uniref:hypothetical protein n=1 Tax=Planotetraspora sp. GP83 TaxID=3156264 RepID=UPI003517BBC1